MTALLAAVLDKTNSRNTHWWEQEAFEPTVNEWLYWFCRSTRLSCCSPLTCLAFISLLECLIMSSSESYLLKNWKNLCRLWKLIIRKLALINWPSHKVLQCVRTHTVGSGVTVCENTHSGERCYSVWEHTQWGAVLQYVRTHTVGSSVTVCENTHSGERCYSMWEHTQWGAVLQCVRTHTVGSGVTVCENTHSGERCYSMWEHTQWGAVLQCVRTHTVGSGVTVCENTHSGERCYSMWEHTQWGAVTVY